VGGYLNRGLTENTRSSNRFFKKSNSFYISVFYYQAIIQKDLYNMKEITLLQNNNFNYYYTEGIRNGNTAIVKAENPNIKIKKSAKVKTKHS